MEADTLDLASRKTQTILQTGVFSKAEVIDTVRLMSEISWSSTVTEQGHAALATVHRLHHRYSKENLVKHAFLRQVRPLFQPYVDRSAKAQAKLEALQKKNPHKLNGKDFFVGQAISALAQKIPPEERKGSGFGRFLMAEANKMWSQLSREAQQDYALQALDQVPRNLEDLLDDVANQLRVAHTTRQESTAEQSEHGQLSRLSNVRFQSADMEAMLDAYVGWAHSHKETTKMGLKFLQAPTPNAMLSSLDEFLVETTGVERSAPAPRWVKVVCHARDICSNAGLMFTHGDPPVDEYFAIIYIVKNQQMVVLSPMIMEPVRYPEPAAGETFAQLSERFRDLPRHTFAVLPDFSPDWEVNAPEDAEVYVVPALQLQGIGSAATECDPVPLEEWCPELPKEVSARASSARGAVSKKSMFDASPWLKDLHPETYRQHQAKTAGAGASEGDAAPSISVFSISEEERAEIFAALERNG